MIPGRGVLPGARVTVRSIPETDRHAGQAGVVELVYPATRDMHRRALVVLDSGERQTFATRFLVRNEAQGGDK